MNIDLASGQSAFDLSRARQMVSLPVSVGEGAL
jgi:hypothetical protein